MVNKFSKWFNKPNKITSAKVYERRSKDLGFTLIESLVAAVVLGILIASVAPLILISTTNRVNARRIDQASQAASSFVQGLKGGTIKPFAPVMFTVNGERNFANVLPRYTASNATTHTYSTQVQKGVTAIDVDNDGSYNGFQDVIIQAIRDCPDFPVGLPNCDASELDTTPDKKAITDKLNQGSYKLLVRVYRGDAFTFGNDPNVGNRLGFLDVIGNPFSLSASVPNVTNNNYALLREPATGFGSKYSPLVTLRSTISYSPTFNEIQIKLTN
jgi:prepilin-type N-terminal cleavage/methylation domain-containing protein